MIEQKWDAAAYARNARFVSELGRPALALLAPREGETILDLCCGDGSLTAEIAESGARVIGLDNDPEMLAAARERGLEVVEASASDFTLSRPVDAVFSNAALHWIPAPEPVIGCVRAALKPGGRFVGEFGGHGNIAAVATAMRGVAHQWGLEPDSLPEWFFPTAGQYRELLEQAGFRVTEIALFPRQTPVPAGLDNWLQLMTTKTLGKLPLNERAKFIEEVSALVAPSLRTHDGLWVLDYVRLRFRAELLDDGAEDGDEAAAGVLDRGADI